MCDRERRGKVNGNVKTENGKVFGVLGVFGLLGKLGLSPRTSNCSPLIRSSPYRGTEGVLLFPLQESYIPAYFSPHRNWYEALIIALLVSLLSIISRGNP